jgi:poly(A) polymerase
MSLLTVSELKKAVEPGAYFLLGSVSRFLAARNVKAYLIGGMVRDLLLERHTADIDIAVDADALEIAAQFAEAIGGTYVLLDAMNRIGRVVPPETAETKGGGEIDFSTLRGTIGEDLSRRDFTIDAMTIDLAEMTFAKGKSIISFPEIIDPFSGQRDIRNRLLRQVSESSFPDDPARLIRAVRLAAELGFTIDGETESAIQRHACLVSGVAGERVREELLKMLALPGAGKSVGYLNELGLLTALIPGLAQGRGVDQPKIHVWDVLEHSLQTVRAVDFILRQNAWDYADEKVLASVPWSPKLEWHFKQEVSHGSTRSALLKLAALLHDIAKPQTKAIDATGRARFLGHAGEGAEIVTDIMQRLRFSAREIKLVELLVRYHLRPTQMSAEGLPTRRAIYRYFRDTEDAGIDILFLSLADHLATRGKTLDRAEWQKHTGVVAYLIEQRFAEESVVVPPKLIDGNDLIKIFGLSPGPRIGAILESVREAQAGGEIKTREEALARAKAMITSPTSENNQDR